MASSGPASAGNPFLRVPISGWRLRPGQSNHPVRCATYAEQRDSDQLKHQGHRMNWRFTKSVFQVEAPGRLIQSMNEQCPNPHIQGHRLTTQHGIPKHGGTQVLPLVLRINSQSSQHHDRDWIGHVATNVGCAFRMGYRASRQRVVGTDFPLLISQHKSSAGTRLLID